MTPVTAVAAVCGPDPRVAAMRPSCAACASTSHRWVYHASLLTARRPASQRVGRDLGEAASREQGAAAKVNPC
jgi:hypothetical protein